MLKKIAHRAYAFAINDKRPHAPFSWGWLNRLAERTFWTNSGAWIRPQYAWGTIFAAAEARALGFDEVSVIEFGVAGGKGLVALESIASEVSHALGVNVRVYGFDLGTGLPDIVDVRDLPQLYKCGGYRMDVSALKSRLDPATTLIIGDLKDTLDGFLQTPHAPVGFVSIDVDLYTSTHDLLRLFNGDIPLTNCLPRVVCYFDDIMGLTFADITGERLAVHEFNRCHSPQRCISPVYGLRYHLGWPHNRAQWPDMMYWSHFLDHPKYCMYDGLVAYHEAPL